jgi:ribosomal protein L30
VSTGIIALWTDHACTHATAARSAMQSTHSSGSSSRLRVVLLLVVLLLLSARGARAIQRKQAASCTQTVCQAGLGTEQLPSRSCRHSPPAPLTSQSLRRHPLALLHEPEGRGHGRSRRPPCKAAGSRHCGGKGELGLHGIGGAFRRVGSLLRSNEWCRWRNGATLGTHVLPACLRIGDRLCNPSAASPLIHPWIGIDGRNIAHRRVLASCSAMEPVQTLFITLKRSFAGTREHHVRILQSLGLRWRQHTVEKPNIAHVRGAVDKVRRRSAPECRKTGRPTEGEVRLSLVTMCCRLLILACLFPGSTHADRGD